MKSSEVLQHVIETTTGEADRNNLRAFVTALENGKTLTPMEIVAAVWGSPSPEIWDDFRRLKSILYDADLITAGHRSGKIRLKRADEMQESEVEGQAPLAAVASEAELNPCIQRWLQAQSWFTYLYSHAETSILGANYNPDILGVAVPEYDNLPFYDVEILALEVKRGKSEFLEDKLLAEVTTYQSFAHYVYAAYFKPWDTIFRPAEPAEYDRMFLLQKYGIGVFWVSCQRPGAQDRNYQCLMIQNALRGNPDPDKMAEVLAAYRDKLLMAKATPGKPKQLGNLRNSARRYFLKEE